MAEKATNWREAHKREAAEFVKRFYQTSWQWRNRQYHTDWDKWQRNYHSIYDPTNKAKKEDWQATMFVPMTVGNVETINSALVKLLLGKKRPLGLDPRESGDELQAELNTDILDYDVEKSGFVLAFHDAQKEACIYGSSFLKFYWDHKTAPARILKPIRVGIMEGIKTRKMPGSIKGYTNEVKQVVTANHAAVEKVHIRDIFLEPNSTDLKRVIHRRKITWGELKRLSEQNNFENEPLFDKDSVDKLWMVYEGDSFEDDVRPLMYELGHDDPKLARPNFDKQHTVWEYWGPIPRKWISLEMPEDTDEQRQKANEIVPGKIMAASADFYLASEENPFAAMEPPVLQVDYIRCGKTYGIGVCQLMAGIQEEANEVRNLRVDNVNLVINKVFAVIEKNIVDMKEVRSMPGGVIRVKGSEAITDARQVVAEIQISDVAISAFRETGELERQAQEVTGANRVTIGTAGTSRDQNQTLGGMELLRQAAFDRFSVTAFVIEIATLKKAAKMLVSLSYLYRDDDSIRRILGEVPLEMMPNHWIPRWQAYKRIPINEIEQDYDFVTVGVFTQENKMQRAQALASFGQFAASVLPSFNPRNLIKRLGHYNDFSKEEVDDILGDLSGPIPTPLAMGQGVPSISKGAMGPAGAVAPPSMTGSAPGFGGPG